MNEHQDYAFEELLPYTEELQEAILSAGVAALSRGQADAEPEHLLLAIVLSAEPPRRLVAAHTSCRGRDLLDRIGVNFDELLRDLEGLVGEPHPNPQWTAYQEHEAKDDSVIARVLDRLDQARAGSAADWNDAVAKAAAIAEELAVADAASPHPSARWSPAMRSILATAVAEARKTGGRFAGTDHAVSAMASEGGLKAAALLEQHGATLEKLREALRNAID